MKVTVKVDILKQLEEQVQSLHIQLQQLKLQEEGFERLDSDIYLVEVYNA